jgi:hypothetical protein
MFAIPLVNLVFLWVFALSRWPSLEPRTLPAAAHSLDGQDAVRSPSGRRGLFLGLALGVGIAAAGFTGWQFFLLKGAATPGDALDANLPLPDGIYFVTADTDEAASGAMMIPNNEADSPPLRVARLPIADTRHFAGAEAAQNEFGSAVVSIQLTDAGSALMLAATSENIGRQLAIVVNGVAITVVTVQSPITSHFQISGNFSLPQAQAIANRLSR